MNNKIIITLLLTMPLMNYSTVIWHGIMSPGSANAINQNVQITGDTWLANETVVIQATTQNIKIYLLNGPHHVYSSNDGQTTIQLQVAAPYSIEIVADYDLTFGGVLNNLTLPLRIQERSYQFAAPGLVKWTIANNHTIYFGDPNDENRGGVSLELVSNNGSLLPKHIFKTNENNDNNAQIKFTRNSGLFLVEETLSAPTNFLQENLIDASNTDNNKQKINFKDGSGWFFKFITD